MVGDSGLKRLGYGKGGLHLRRVVLTFALTMAMVFTTASSVSGSEPAEVDLLEQEGVDRGIEHFVPKARIKWRTCDEVGLEGLECGSIRVPLDCDRPHGRTIEVQVAWLAATDQANKLGTIFLNPGGPGGSGIDFVAGAGPNLYTDELRAKYDLVGFDPRGIARSKPLRCFDTFEEALLSFRPFAFPTGDEQEAIEKAATEYLAEACEEDAGRIIRHMSTANVARDMNMMRRAVGNKKLNYAGYSYGSFLGPGLFHLIVSVMRSSARTICRTFCMAANSGCS
ncbi:MAG: alpha/beta hydrolase [bacterium]|nr:alpha/beta hydrolase [bacterium]